MEVTVLAFGVAREIVGKRSLMLALDEHASVQKLRDALEQQFPALKDIASYAVAVNNEYAYPADTIGQNDEIAIIPPVSGG